MVRAYHASLVVLVLVLACMGLNLSARGINSLTLSQDPILVLQTNSNVIEISTLGENYVISRQATVAKTKEIEHIIIVQAWKSFKSMGRALTTYSNLMQ